MYSRTIASIHKGFELSFNVTAVNNRFGAKLHLDEQGRISARINAAVDTVRNYVYDASGRLTQENRYRITSPSCTPHQAFGTGCTVADSIYVGATSYTYDQVGNLTSGVTQLDIPGNRVRAANGYSFNYDADGYLASKIGSGFTQTFGFDALGQLTSAATNGTTIEFGYDAFGRRVRKAFQGTTTRFVYDGNNLQMEVDGNGDPWIEYAYWGVDQPYAMCKGGTTYYYILDPVGGHVKGMVRSSDSTVQAQYNYSAYGSLESGSFDNIGNLLRFGSREYDPETVLHYNRARFYDPLIGRFISEDPAGIDGGMSFYSYAGNDPINFNDPFGDKTRTVCGFIWVRGTLVTTVSGGRTITSEEPGKYMWTCTEEEVEAAGAPHTGLPSPRNEPTQDRNWKRSASCSVNLGLQAASAPGRDAAYVRGRGKALEWLGRNGKWYSVLWGGNGATAGRNAVVAAGSKARYFGKVLGTAGMAFSLGQAAGAYNVGEYHEGNLSMMDVAAGGVGMVGGGLGLTASLAWFTYRFMRACGG